MENTYVFYYEFESMEDGGKVYGGFLQASSYADAMGILEDYTGSDLGGIRMLKAYDNAIICVPKEEAHKMKAIYEKTNG